MLCSYVDLQPQPRLVTVIRHLPYEERLQRRRLQVDLITAFKIFTGLVDVDPNMFYFSLPLVAALEANPTGNSKMRATAEGDDRRFPVMVMKDWNKLPS